MWWRILHSCLIAIPLYFELKYAWKWWKSVDGFDLGDFKYFVLCFLFALIALRVYYL